MESSLIAITGASGFIGRRLLPHLSRLGRVRCFARPASAQQIASHNSAEIFEGDLAAETDFTSFVKNADTVIHLAALLRTETRQNIHRVNVDATKKLVEACRQNGVRHFVYLSSENALRTDLKDAYAESKREAESIVASFPGHLILRPCMVYGPENSHGLGTILRFVLKARVVPLFGGLKSFMQPLFVDDLIEIILAALHERTEGAFTVPGPEILSLNNFIETAVRLSGRKIKTVTIPKSALFLAAAALEPLGLVKELGPQQLKNIYHSKTYDPCPLYQRFGITPTGLEKKLLACLNRELP